MGGLSFAQDAEGNWGYKAPGADTVFPFSGIATLLWKNPNLSAPMNAQTISGFGGENYKQLLIQTNHRTVAGLQTAVYNKKPDLSPGYILIIYYHLSFLLHRCCLLSLHHYFACFSPYQA